MTTVTAPNFDDVKVGDAIKPIVLPPISRHQLALYCGGSGDHNPINVDLDFAKKFGFKAVFAHGMLSMAFLGCLVTSFVPQAQVRNLGTRFTSITWVGDVITVSGTVTGKREAIAKKTYIRAPKYPQSAFDKALAECKADTTWQTFVNDDTGHDVMIDQPQWLTNLLLKVS